MTYELTLTIYDPQKGKRTEHVELLPTRVTRTGKEDHFARAYEDATIVKRTWETAVNTTETREGRDRIEVGIKTIRDIG